MSTKNMIANRYEVIQHIGQGGMADVFLAIDTILNRHVAVKILRADLSGDAVSILRFEREAQAATALAHPNIVEVYDVGDYKGHHYIVMEYVPGKTLKQIIRERGPLMNEEGIDIMKQLVSAIAEAHSRGIIHRDIKPQNVIVKSDGSIKILDFGIATAKGSMQLTQANNVMGSVHYLAPELARGIPASVQSDVYALGIVMFELFAGDVPFKAEQAVQIALMHMRDPLPSLRAINPMVPQSIENIVLKAAAKNPEDRYRSAGEMLADLETCLLPERLNEPRITSRKFKEAKPSYEMSFSDGKPVDLDDDEDDEEEEETRPKKKKKMVKQKHKMNGLTKMLIALLVVLALIVGALSLGSLGIFDKKPQEVSVPDLIGHTIQDATNVCADSSLVLDTDNVEYMMTEDTDKGIIIAVSPDIGTSVVQGSAVKVTVSSGIGIKVPDLTGMNIQEAEETMKQFPMVTLDVETESGSGQEPGTVIRQEGLKAGDLFSPSASAVLHLVYEEYASITIPSDIENMPINEAVSRLESMGVQVTVSNIDTSTMSAEERANLQYGVVVRSDPAIGNAFTQLSDNYVVLYYY